MAWGHPLLLKMVVTTLMWVSSWSWMSIVYCIASNKKTGRTVAGSYYPHPPPHSSLYQFHLCLLLLTSTKLNISLSRTSSQSRIWFSVVWSKLWQKSPGAHYYWCLVGNPHHKLWSTPGYFGFYVNMQTTKPFCAIYEHFKFFPPLCWTKSMKMVVMLSLMGEG